MSGRILVPMSRRLGALLLVLVVAGAPAALTACEIVCAARDSHAAADGSGSAAHSCHGTRPSDGPLIGTGVQICGHDEELPAAAAAQTAPPLVAAVAILTPSILSSVDGVLHRVHLVVPSPPGHPQLPVPLRI